MTETKFPEGTLVHAKGHGEQVFTITDHFIDDAVSCYYADGATCYGMDFAESDLTLVMSAGAASRRKIPTAREIIGSLNVCSHYDDFLIDATDRDGDAALECYGTTNDGLRFAFNLAVSDVAESDF